MKKHFLLRILSILAPGLLVGGIYFILSIYIPEIRIKLGLPIAEEDTQVTVGKSNIYFETQTLFLFNADSGMGRNRCEGRLFFNEKGKVLFLYSCPDNKRYYELGTYIILEDGIKCAFNGKAIVVDSNFYTNKTDITIESDLSKNTLILKAINTKNKERSNYFFEHNHITYSCYWASGRQLEQFIQSLKEEGSYNSIQKEFEIVEIGPKSFAKIF